jgi:putative heme-binding domain-containing protein
MKCPLAALAVVLIPTLTSAAPFELKPDDHICIIGNTLADRMQHDGWLETLLQARFPKYKLVFRNLGFSGDELTIRLRSKSFGTPDEWLAGSAPVPEPGRLTTRKGVRDNRFETTNTRADVVFAFFGYNESHAGAAGLDKFKADLKNFIKHTLAQKYNGKTAPRLVLFSPIAHEHLPDRNLPDGKDNNRRLEMYTKAMAEVAAAEGVTFVDLFGPTQKLYEKAEKPLTINGIHLNEKGNEVVARVIDRALFGEPTKKLDEKDLEKLRQAVVEKDFYWFNRYRVLDGYNVYGGRAFERYAEQQSNYEDQQRELEIIDVMTSNRDKLVWARAAGGNLKVDDSNVPPFIPVKTNKPGKGPDGTHIYLSGEDGIKKMTVGKGMKVTLFASEKEFPELAKPVQMAFDTKGRLWVAVWPSYPHWKPGEPMNDKLLILEDTKGTGKADKCTVFADHLNCPTGFEFYNGGVLVAQAPDVIFLKDTKGTGKADLRLRVLHGLDSADSHHTSNSFTLDPGGALYFQEGTFHHSQVETPYGPPQRCVNAGVFRYEPRTQKFEVYITHAFANPHGHIFDRWGQDIVIDGTGANPYHAALFSGYLPYPEKHRTPPQVWGKHPRPCPGMEILSSRHFPPEFQGNVLVANVIGFQGISRYKLSDKGGSIFGEEQEPILSSTDPNFRPSDLKIGPDGAIWFIDWHNTIIGHLQHAIRDPSRDRTHGRIYRVTYEDRKLLTSPPIAGEPIDKLLALLREPEDRVRYRARIELGGRKTDDVVAAVKKWIGELNEKDPQYEHELLEALWVHQNHNVVDVDLLKRVLSLKDFHARAAATRVLCYWRDRVPGALEMLKKLAADQSPRVRLEAVRAASFFTEPEAIEVVLVAQDQAADPYVDFVASETRRALDPIWKAAIASAKTIPVTTDAGARFFLRNITLEQLLKLPRTRSVNLELLYRSGVRDELRREALRALAREDKKPELRVLLDAIARIDDKTENRDEQTLFDLIRLLAGRTPTELSGIRADLEKLALASRQPVIRQIGFVALVNVDGNTDKAWTLALKSIGNLRDLVNAVPMIADPALRAALYPKIEALLAGLPEGLKGSGPGKTTKGRYVRIELPGRRRTLTLAEVEVLSDGKNLARQGKASQKNTGFGGTADRAIDGNKEGSFSGGGQTHTLENTSDPWWEVDLGGEHVIDAIVIYNRTDGNFGKRLDGFTLQVLGADHKTVVFERKGQPAPPVSVRVELGREDPERLVRRAAMNALTSVRGQETKTFKTLAGLLREENDRSDAIHALQRIPRSFWDKEQARPLLDILLAAIRKIPEKERTSATALDALEMADALTTLLPADDAKKVRAELGELGVRVIRIATVVEKMSYDKDVVVVKAGKPVEFLFENVDLMPHNLVITKPGALQEIGELAEATGQQADAQARHFVPKSDKILLSSTLLQPREVQKLSFVAPAQPGVFPIVCTYPGHWRRMYLALYVVDDLDGYLANPEAYLAKKPMTIKDDLLKDRRPRTEWKYDDLAAAARELKARSYANGKSMFQVATCISCHKLEGVGQEFGPDLTKLDAKIQAPEEILRHVLEPSLKIDDKYVVWIFDTKKGVRITGMILEETKDMVKIIENPLAKAEARVLKKEDIEERMKSPVSLMPKGLLDKLSRDEILDLIAYVASKGQKDHRLFQAEGHEHHGH